MGRTVRGDLGRSIASKVSVNRLLASSLPISLQMGLLAAVFLALLGIPLGVLAALRHNTWLDYLIVSLALVVRSVPVFVLAPLLLILLVLQIKIMDVPVGWKGIATPPLSCRSSCWPPTRWPMSSARREQGYWKSCRKTMCVPPAPRDFLHC